MPATEACIDADGWFHSGDLVRVDAEGYITVVDRIKDVIFRGGYNVYPREVEIALEEHGAITAAAVVGVPDEKRHQLVKAFVILKGGKQPSRELALDMFKHTIDILAKFKIPRIIEFVSEVPKTLSGKIRRVELREREVERQESQGDSPDLEFYYWDFPELSSRKN